ncbi:MAG: AAA family ATPase [Pseudomonadota bacterium]
MALPDTLHALLDPASYPHPCNTIELIETHISWVLLTGEFAYKLKKPVHFNFVDFSTLERRAHFCREEVRCNRAFAPDIYLGVVAVCADAAGALTLSPDADPSSMTLEWAVQMRQFDPALALDRVLERGELGRRGLDTFGRDLARRHGALPVLEGTAADVPARIFGPVTDNFEEIESTPLAEDHAALIGETSTAARALGAALRAHFDERISTGQVRECHGDLHLANLALIDGVVTAFDCLEFNDNLRWIDTMSDVAFLFMDCLYRGEQSLAYGFLDGYLDESGDYKGVPGLAYFAAYRSVVRAKVAALRWVQSADTASAESSVRHLEWTRRWLARPPGKLILTCGLSGSGKSYLAQRLLGELPAVRLRSDVARKQLAGLAPLAASGSGVESGLYDPQQSDATFDHLATVAGALLRSGEHVIVDATFIERARRDRFRSLAAELGTAARILYCEAPLEILEARLATRAATGADPSEADRSVLALQLERFDAPGAEEPVHRIDSTMDLDERALTDLAGQLLAD